MFLGPKPHSVKMIYLESNSGSVYQFLEAVFRFFGNFVHRYKKYPLKGLFPQNNQFIRDLSLQFNGLLRATFFTPNIMSGKKSKGGKKTCCCPITRLRRRICITGEMDKHLPNNRGATPKSVRWTKLAHMLLSTVLENRKNGGLLQTSFPILALWYPSYRFSAKLCEVLRWK